MRKIYLHIGIWKTGTTTIQKTLHSSRDILMQNDVYYPDIDSNHTFMASAFHDAPDDFIVAKSRGISGDILSEWHRSSLKKFETEIAETTNTVISSEFLLDLSKHKIRTLKEYLEKHFDEIAIITYIRHPIDHVTSAINEQVKQGHYDLEKAYSIHGEMGEYQKIENWLSIFGEDSFVIRPFVRSRFVNNDLVTDFLSIIFGDSIPQLRTLKNEENCSLSYPALLIADKLSKLAPSFSKQRGHSNYLQRIAGPKYILPIEVQNTAIECSVDFLTKYNIKFGLNFDLEKRTNGGTDLRDVWGEEVIHSLAGILNDFSLKLNFSRTDYDKEILQLKNENRLLRAKNAQLS